MGSTGSLQGGRVNTRTEELADATRGNCRCRGVTSICDGYLRTPFCPFGSGEVESSRTRFLTVSALAASATFNAQRAARVRIHHRPTTIDPRPNRASRAQAVTGRVAGTDTVA